MTMEHDPLGTSLRRFFAAEMPSEFRPPPWNAPPPTSPPALAAAKDGHPGRATLALSLIALAAAGTVLLVKPAGRMQPAAPGGELLKTATADGSKLGLPPLRPVPNP